MPMWLEIAIGLIVGLPIAGCIMWKITTWLDGRD